MTLTLNESNDSHEKHTNAGHGIDWQTLRGVPKLVDKVAAVRDESPVEDEAIRNEKPQSVPLK